jgi:Mg2+ and Co2+ transporter CorA
VKLALDYQIAENTEQQAARADEMAAAQHKLNVLAAVTFPLMAIATLLGMNLVHGFETEPPALFWSVVILGFIVGFVVKGWVTKAKG